MKTQRLKQIKWNRHTFSSKTAYNAKKSYVYFKNKNTSYIKPYKEKHGSNKCIQIICNRGEIKIG